jgi:hypothetical protein
VPLVAGEPSDLDEGVLEAPVIAEVGEELEDALRGVGRLTRAWITMPRF